MKIKIYRKIKGRLLQYFCPRHPEVLNRKWCSLQYIFSHKSDFNESFLELHKDVVEIEHQVGRFLNMRKIALEIRNNKYEGDIVEFGTFQGLGLIYLSELVGGNRLFVGVDSFEGLPISSTIWKKGQFSDTCIDAVYKNLYKWGGGIGEFFLIKGWFNSPDVINELHNRVKDIILVHFDADLGISTKEALTCIEPYLENRKKPIYLLFDDWGCHPDEVPDAFYAWVEKNKEKNRFDLQKLSSTRYTRYYKINFI